MHPDNPKWVYMSIKVSNKGGTTVMRPDGGQFVVPDEHISVTLNKFGKEGWELVQSDPNPDSSGSTYIMKRPAPPTPE
jgi:hypothetical protein